MGAGKAHWVHLRKPWRAPPLPWPGTMSPWAAGLAGQKAQFKPWVPWTFRFLFGERSPWTCVLLDT